MTSYVITITIMGIHPPIWRRLMVPGEISLDRLHEAIQIAIGWEDRHLHLFRIKAKIYTDSPEENWEGDETAYEESNFRLSELVTRETASFEYEYDFGDGWRHAIIVESIVKVAPGQPLRIACLGGQRHCPPEDIGGADGYQLILHARTRGKTDADDGLLTLDEDFDPEHFNLQATNRRLRSLPL